ncbi:DNA cytosine methyltransferase [Streptomyces sp. NEAU-174]|uniref:DNA cytosine methyltransferase n=1 Tax=Streptomyces sp. NEAU-174 TaxID=3458254 RepID=UPI004045022C
MITFCDLFCGAGGASTGLVNAGWKLVLAANHWQTAVDTHQANHPDAEHVCADLDHYDMRRLPRTDVLWASPICTEMSPAGGRRRNKNKRKLSAEQMRNLTPEEVRRLQEELEALPDAAFERTRATAYDVLRACEVHRYKAVLIENVVEFATDWILFDLWLAMMVRLGYNYQILCVSSAHIGDERDNLAAPQWRDRLYIVFTQVGIRLPDIAPRPLAWCQECDERVYSQQTWRSGHTETRIGKYQQQYDYTCPNHDHDVVVEPYTRPASSIINWRDIGTRIGDRKRPLVPGTMAKIQKGLDMFPSDPWLVTLNHGGHDGRHFRPDQAPFPARTAKIGEGLVIPRDALDHASVRPDLAAPPFVITYRNHGGADTVDRPLTGINAKGNHHGLVIPYRKGCLPKTTDDPLHTMSTRDSAGLLVPAADIQNCHFRMIKWREQMSAQGFPEDYIVTGSSDSAKTMQAGNAVSRNVAQWLGYQVTAVL